MTIVAGFDPDGRGRAVLHLAGMLARSMDVPLVVCSVVPAAWPPGVGRVDAEYRAQLERDADAALAKARSRLGDDLPVRLVIEEARSAPAGLLEVAERSDTALIVCGSAVHGPLGQVTLGSVTTRLMHSSHVAVAVAPRGFRARDGARVRRVTAAYGGTETELVQAAARVTARAGAELRVASFAVQPRAPVTAGVGRLADDEIVTEWVHETRAALPDEHQLVVGRGETWEEAMEDVDWEDGDVLVVGSSSIGPVARVFLGSRATKIVRHSPVPVVVVPREVASAV
jgi:nucleotide-binding universal stress UspA family protein